jgi:hypothetical protein
MVTLARGNDFNEVLVLVLELLDLSQVPPRLIHEYKICKHLLTRLKILSLLIRQTILRQECDSV